MTENIIAEDHDKGCHVIDIIVAQQQSRDLELAGEFNIIERQDYGMIDIKELINNWLKKVV